MWNCSFSPDACDDCNARNHNERVLRNPGVLARRSLLQLGIAAGGLASMGMFRGQAPESASPTPTIMKDAGDTASAVIEPSDATAVDLLLGGPVFDAPSDPEGWVLAHRQLGYRAAFAPPVLLDDLPRVREFEQMCSRHGLTIAEAGVWNNLLDADPARATANLKAMEHGLALADELGARCCVNIPGSFCPDIWFGPSPKNFSREFFDRVVENARKIIDAVNPKRAKLAWEMMGWAMPSTAEQYLELIAAIDRPAFAVHLDPVNAVNRPELFYDTTAHLNHLFDLLGPYVVSCHAKDLQWVVEMNIHFVEVECGKGVIDFATYLKRVAALPQKPPVMLEHMPDAATYDRCRETLLRICTENGLRA